MYENKQRNVLVKLHFFSLFAALSHIVGVPIKTLNTKYIYLKKLTFQKITTHPFCLLLAFLKEIKVDRVVPSVKLMKGVLILEIMGNRVEIEIEEEVLLGGVVLVEVRCQV